MPKNYSLVSAKNTTAELTLLLSYKPLPNGDLFLKMQDFIYGFKQALSGFGLIFKPRIKKYVLIPFLINLCLFSIGLWWLVSLVDSYLPSLVAWLPDTLNLPRFLNWINSVYSFVVDWLSWLKWLVLVFFVALYAMVVFYTFTLLANLISSPFNGFFAAEVERYLYAAHNSKPVQLAHVERPLRQEVSIAISGELRKYWYMLKWLLPILLLVLVLFFIPLLNAIIPFIWFVFGAWMMSIEYADYPLGNYGFTFVEEKELLRQHRFLAMGFGSAIMLMTMIPIVNFFALPVGVAGATQMMHNRLRDKLPKIEK